MKHELPTPKNEAEAFLIMGYYYTYVASPTNLKAGREFLLQAEELGSSEAAMIRHILERDTLVCEPLILRLETAMLRAIASTGGIKAVLDTGWLMLNYPCTEGIEKVAHNCLRLASQPETKEKNALRLLYADLIAIPCTKVYDVKKVLDVVECYVSDNIPDAEKHMLKIHFLHNACLLPKERIEELLFNAERKQQPVALYRGYHLLCLGKFHEAFRVLGRYAHGSIYKFDSFFGMVKSFKTWIFGYDCPWKSFFAPTYSWRCRDINLSDPPPFLQFMAWIL